jgi:hypothetical protein
MYYNKNQASLTGQKRALSHALDLLSIDLQQAWKAYSRRGEEMGMGRSGARSGERIINCQKVMSKW